LLARRCHRQQEEALRSPQHGYERQNQWSGSQGLDNKVTVFLCFPNETSTQATKKATKVVLDTYHPGKRTTFFGLSNFWHCRTACAAKRFLLLHNQLRLQGNRLTAGQSDSTGQSTEKRELH